VKSRFDLFCNLQLQGWICQYDKNYTGCFAAIAKGYILICSSIHAALAEGNENNVSNKVIAS